MSKKTKNAYQLCLRSNDDESQIEDFKLDAFFPPLAKGQRLEMPGLEEVFLVEDSTVEIRHLVELKVMRFSTILYVSESEEKGRSF